MPTPKVVMWWVTVVPSFGVSVSTGSNTTVTREFLYNMGTDWVSSYIMNDEGSGSWTSNGCQVSKITRIWTAKIKWENKQHLRARNVMPIWSLWRWTFYWIHSDWTYMSDITWIAASVTSGTITPTNYVWYLTINYNDKIYKIPYYN